MLRRGILESIQRALLAIILLITLAIIYLALRSLSGEESSTTTSPQTEPPPKKVGILAGHWGYDSGAVCPDGLTEVEVNLQIARLVVVLLIKEGYDAEILPEFSPKLRGYRADAFLSIHSDSCDIPTASGFKVARVARSAVPKEEDRLVECLRRRYEEITGLSFHEHSITSHMRGYYAFYEIAPDTPGVIIEVGFLGADRKLLTESPEKVAEGIVEGILCFLEGV